LSRTGKPLLTGIARKVAIGPLKTGPSDIDELHAAGLGHGEIVDAAAACCSSALTDTVTDSLKLANYHEMMGMQDEYF
jgi:hypothetical protein